MINFNLFPLLLSLLLSALINPLVIFLYQKKDWLDDPQKNKHPKVIHEKAVPRGGGIAIFLAVLISCCLFLPIDKHLLGILVGALVLTFVGILDDIYDLDPKLRLIMGFLAAAIVVGSGIGIAYISNPLGNSIIDLSNPRINFNFLGPHSIWILADIFALLWIVSLMNFINWSKGLDGQLPGTVSIAALTIALLAGKFSADITQWNTQTLALIICGAFLGLLIWNIYPQKIMPGYGGGSLAGYFLAVLAILSTTKVGTLMIVLGIPLVDAIYVILRRIMAGKSPLWGDTRHLHHTLLKLGWSKQKIAYFYWFITAILGILALNLNSQQKFYTIILIIIAFGIFLIWIRHYITSSSAQDRDNGSKI
ncbi:undecaprenyl/decaprenyl-phosphate alpha-N-acetylglucosaminyl 1-phosphate transferase [Candidatus Beckwithbacteria bacterium]|nr:undecaprenyl/decaprenyl-phosphate alpha-N-acetylglucosaminyl 1-phosphate transferase [Candidatus Beckwithbacteria bacterium]